MKDLPSTIRIDPPLPCGILDCENDASVAIVGAARNGEFAIRPICERCAAAMRKIYKN